MTFAPRTIGNVREVDITNQMQIAYLDYAMSVIVSRALPDVRDGLKPVHRRILYAMHDMGLTNEKPYKKSARIVGEVLGKYHPHGDSAVYDAMVRMAQNFSLRYPLVDGQGNFGSMDGDNAAAMRYTEARLARISDLMLADLEKETVDWTDNFDNTLKEPEILPAVLPNLLINGASGIAVGMSTNIPPHNLGEVVDALVHMIDNYKRIDDISLEEIQQFIKGPDFPTGGIAFRYRKDRRGKDTNDVITQGYSTGRGRLIVQAKAHIEQMSRGRMRIVVTELPYQTNKTNLLERIAALVRDGKIEGITDMRDESDRAGMRIVFEISRNVDAKAVLADLFKYTPMQQTFGMSMLALVDGEPRMLPLKRMLQLFLEHRQTVIRRRSEYDLARARERAHIVEGLLKALDILDEVIDTIRRSQRVDTARNNLMRNFGFTQVQAQAILDMPLKRLAALERRKLQDEYSDLQKTIAYLEDLLANPEKVLTVIREELTALREKYADPRRTQIVDRTRGTLTSTDLLPEQKVWISVGTNGEVRRQDFATVTKTSLRQTGRDSDLALLAANTRDYLYLFSKSGACQRVAIHELPENEPKHLAEFTDYTRRSTISAALVLPRLSPEEATGYLFLVTKGGTVKRITLADFVKAAADSPEVMRVDDRDELGWVFPTPGEQEVILVASGGRSIRFPEEDVRSMGLPAGGVAGMKLKKGERIVAAAMVDPHGDLLTVTAAGYTKRTPLSEYSSQGRNGSGIIAHKTNKRTGGVIDALVINPERRDLLVFITEKGVPKPVEIDEIPQVGRNTLGQEVVTTARGDALTAVKIVESVPGFVDDETLTPPPASNNGRKNNGSGSSTASSRSSRARSTSANGSKSSGAPKTRSRSAASNSKKSTRAKKAGTEKQTSRKTTSKASDEEPAAAETNTKKKRRSRKSSSESSGGKTSKNTSSAGSSKRSASRSRKSGTQASAASTDDGEASGRKKASNRKRSSSGKAAGDSAETESTAKKKTLARKSAKRTSTRKRGTKSKVEQVSSVTKSQKKKSK